MFVILTLLLVMVFGGAIGYSVYFAGDLSSLAAVLLVVLASYLFGAAVARKTPADHE